jgi:hypothetical protein
MLLLVVAAGSAQANDGRIQISQADALAGSVTASDSPGFPVTLDAAGSYVLTSDLIVASAASHAIALTTGDVTIDLNGFSIIGPASCTGGASNGTDLVCTPVGAGNGIDANHDFVTIRNGTVRGFGNRGLSLGSSCRVSDVTVTENVTDGMYFLNDCIIRHSVAWRNGEDGFHGDNVVLLVGNTSNRNKAYGMRADEGSAFIGNTASDNGTDGIAGFVGTNVVRNNSAESNGNFGIRASAGAVVTGNMLRNNDTTQLLLNALAGYGQNIITLSTNGDVTVTGGVDMGDNDCNGSTTCP